MSSRDDVPHVQPDVIASVRDDLTDWNAWLSRAIILVYAAAAGLCVVGFTKLSEFALNAFETLYSRCHWAPLLWTPAVCALLARLTERHFPGASGSGIPQVMAALHTSVDDGTRPAFVSLRLSVAKIVLTAAGLLGGLPIGREGPSVQIAAGVMLHARRWLPERSAVTAHGLLIAGGAAGIAAAFNAPLAGITFAIEELTSKLEQRSSGLVIGAIVLSGVIAISAFGNQTYFGVIRVPHLEASFIWPGLLAITGSGLLGGFFSRLLQASLITQPGRMGGWRRRHPVWFATGCGMVIAIIGCVAGGATFGSGYGYTRQLLEGRRDLPVLYVTLRMTATWLATWSGLPGGLFAPALAIGAGIGNDVALLTGWVAESPALIALGMVGFLAAVTQAPITSFIIVMEMVDGHAMVLSLMTAALGASLIARWLAHPLYGSLAAALRARLARIEPAHSPA